MDNGVKPSKPSTTSSTEACFGVLARYVALIRAFWCLFDSRLSVHSTRYLWGSAQGEASRHKAFEGLRPSPLTL